ncbi:unnamed protein product [Penicillium manginii]
MSLHLSFPFLFACAFPIILAAPSSSAYLQNNIPTQLPTGNTNPEHLIVIPDSEGNTDGNPETGRLFSRNHEPQEPVIYGKDDTERQIAMCEAGFVRSCYAAVEAGNSDTNSPSPLPSAGFVVATFAAFCILAMIRKSLGRRSATSQQDEKK